MCILILYVSSQYLEPAETWLMVFLSPETVKIVPSETEPSQGKGVQRIVLVQDKATLSRISLINILAAQIRKKPVVSMALINLVYR